MSEKVFCDVRNDDDEKVSLLMGLEQIKMGRMATNKGVQVD